MHGVPLTPAPVPGSPAWLGRMSASKVAAVVGLSQWESRFSLWHRMAGLIEPQPDDDAKRRGHYLEPAIVDWFADQHPDRSVTLCGTYLHPERDWQAATPDALVSDDALLEVKTTADDLEWGPAGSDQIPVGYRAQVMWQMDTLGVGTAFVAVLLPFLEFRQYVIDYDADEAAYLVRAAREFMDSLPGGPAESRPGLDTHTATYDAVRVMHPDINGDDVDIPADLWVDYQSTKAASEAATAQHRRAKAAVLDAMGDARRALVDGVPVLRRQPSSRGAVALYAVKPKGEAA